MKISFRQQRSACLIAAGCLAMTSTVASGQFQAHSGPAERVFNAEAYIDYQFGIPASGQSVGSLFSAVNNVPEHPAALLPSQEKGVRVAINPGAIEAIGLVADARLTMPCFDGQTFELAFVLEEKLGRDTSIWYGQIAGVPRSDVILVHHKGYVGAEIRDYASKRHYQIRPTPDGGQALYEVKQADNAGAWCGGHGAGGAVPYDPQIAPQGRRNLRGSVSDPINQVDIMTIVTLEARLFYGFEENFVLESALAVGDFNLRADNSISDVNLRLVAADWDLAGSYSEASALGGDLAAMRTGGSLHSAVQSARELYRPDVIAMIRQFPDGSIQGLAARPLSLPIPTSTCISTNVRGGSLSFVGYIFAHEVGHNFGGAHDLATLIDDGGSPFPGQFPAVTDSPMGYVITCENGCIAGDEHWHTTMAYGPNSLCGGSVLLPYFSRPNFTFDAPFPCGTYDIGADPFIFIGSNVGDLLFRTRSSVSDNLLHATLAWTEPALSGFQSEEGTHLFPYSRITDAVNTVQGGPDNAVVRAKAGTYEETQAAGGPVVFSNGTQINAIGGVVVIR